MKPLTEAFLLFWLLSFPFLICAGIAFTEPITYGPSIVTGEVSASSMWLFIGAVVEVFWLLLVFPICIPKPESAKKEKGAKK